MSDATTPTAGAEGAGTPAPVEGGEAPITEVLTPVEGEEATTPVEGEEVDDAPPPPAKDADPPRLAAAKKLLKDAEARVAAADAKEAAVAEREQHLTAEVERVKAVIHEGWADLQLGRGLRALAKQPAKLFAALQKELGVTAQQLAQGMVAGDEDDRPMSRREYLEMQAQQQREADDAKKTADAEKDRTAVQTRAANEQQFVELARGAAATGKLLSVLGRAGAAWVLEEGYRAEASRKGTAYDYRMLLDDVEKAAAEKLAALGVAPAAPAPTHDAPAGTGARPPVGLSNGAASARPSKAPLTRDELWDRAWLEQKGARLGA